MRRELVQKLYEIIQEVYPDVQIRSENEPGSAMIQIVETKYFTEGKIYTRKYYSDGENRWKVIGDKVIKLHIYLYYQDSDTWDVELLETKLINLCGIHISNPDREVPIRLISLTTERQSLWKAVYSLEIVDQIFKEVSYEL